MRSLYCLSVSSLSSFEPIFRKSGMNIISLVATPITFALISYKNCSDVNVCIGKVKVILLPRNVESLSDV